ncbi:MAG: glycoside hydrolase family 99-like domain-containing protein [Saccharofermentans sp.]|nr:glycoside hydrolase family 99-like domain-containing protein [Saccharofermentans sp.]
MKKLIAFFLPQFHTFPENDEWWGKGFTEWTNTKKSVPLFKGHNQPRTPLNDNFYCLLDEETQEWQSKLAVENGIYGFCYYHYWFNGKMLLQKPMEIMLKNPNIKNRFCVSWANESWARTWDGQEKQYLIKQVYGGQEDWEAHLQYLLPFFQDERYIQIDGKPLMLLYTTSRIKDCDEMVKYWNERIKEYGFKGIYIVETLNAYQKEPVLENSSAEIYFEPAYTIAYDLKKQNIFAKMRRFILAKSGIGNVLKFDARVAFKYIATRSYKSKKTAYAGTFTDWDNTPRKGRKGTVMTHNSPKLFEENLNALVNRDDIGDFIFVNAWNEWAEGAYLEPDTHNEYKYLEICKKVFVKE